MPDAPSDFFDVAILKISSRCNINCRYCYMFNLADQSWRAQPKVMSRSVLRTFFERAEVYLQENRLAEFSIVAHGGEPLLAGHKFFLELGQLTRRLEEATGTSVRLSMQTNGLLLDDNWLAVLREAGVSFGVSIDGRAEVHDRHRLTFSGVGTHKAVEDKIRWLTAQPDSCELFRGVLCVLQPDMDGRDLVRYLYELGVRSCDLLLPDQNYSYPSELYASPKEEPTYGVVLRDAYDEWRRIDDPKFSIQFFEELVRSLLGSPPNVDCLGTSPIRIFTVAASGEIEPLDTFKCCGEAYVKTGRSIFDTPLSDLAHIPSLRIPLDRSLHMATECLSCEFKAMCGGGYMPHRFKDGSFANPSIYCTDLKYVCSNISRDIDAELGNIPELLTSYLANFNQAGANHG